MERSLTHFETIEAKQITSCTLVGYIGKDFPMKRGNCFSVEAEDGKDYRIVNFNHENIEELLERRTIEFPVKISPIGEGVALIADERIPTDWYDSRYCETCTPRNLLPQPQQLRIFLDIQSGK